MEAGVVTATPEMAAVAAVESRASAIACRLLDVGIAAVLIVVLVPLFALLALAIAIDSPGKVIFRQRRVGRGGHPFIVNKFRTMQAEASSQTHRDYVLQLIAGDEDAGD